MSAFQIDVALNSTFNFTQAQSDGSDVRFTASDGTTVLPMWIENWNATTGTASAWVQVPSIPAAGTTIYMYYGNAAATTVSSGSSTFLFFDDFEAGVIDASKWTSSGGTWSVVSATQQFGTTGKVAQGVTTAVQTLSSSYAGTDYVVESYGRQVAGRVWGLGVRFNSAGNLYSLNLYADLNSGTNLYEYRWLKNAAVTVGSAAVGTVNLNWWYKLTVKAHGSTFDVYKDGALKFTGTNTQFASGKIALYGEAGGTMQYNNVLVRKYAATEPTATVGAP